MHHPVADGVRLAGEDKAGLQFAGLQRVCDVHIHFALHQFGLASGAHAALAGVGQVHAVVDAGIEDVFPF